MPIDLAYATGSAVTVTATEMSLATTGGTTVGVPQSKTDVGLFTLFLNASAMVTGDEYLLKHYEKAVAGDTQLVVFEVRLQDAQSQMLVIPDLKVGIGWDTTLQRISATSRPFSWSIRRVS